MIIGRRLSAMTTTATILLALIIAVPAAILVYRTHRKVGDYRLYSIADLVERATRDPEHPFGPDADRIINELSTLTRHAADDGRR